MFHQLTSTIFIAGSDDLVHGNALCFYSRDLGNIWFNLLLEIADPIIDLVTEEDGWIYFTTPDSGVYRFNPSLVGIESADHHFNHDNFQLFQNYPNLFNSSTVINFYVKGNKQVELRIRNILGEEIWKWTDNQLISGYHSMTWDG